KVPTIAAFAFRHRIGLPYSYPDNDLSYEGNFLNMMFKTTELKYEPNPTLERALSVLFILHADHEQNCSTNAMRSIGSAHTDPYSALAGAAAALYGPLHGGANEAVLRMLKEIGSIARFPVDMFPVLFAIPRTSGWLAQWVELLEDPEQKIARPRQIYLGQRTRDYVAIGERDGAAAGHAAGAGGER